MDPDRYCTDLAAPPGSSLHYATLWAGARERGAIVAIHALRHALVEIVDTIADANVRATKLNWWSGEILHARDGRPHHPVSMAVVRHCGTRLWHRPEMLAMLSAVSRASAEDGFASGAARDAFCQHVGGGTARLCAAATTDGDAPRETDAIGTAYERALLAGTPRLRPGLRRIPASTSEPAGGVGHGGPNAGPESIAEGIAEERARAREALADAIRGTPLCAGQAALVYRTLARIQLAALAAALRRPAAKAPAAASVSPIRKLWIAWRASREAGRIGGLRSENSTDSRSEGGEPRDERVDSG